MSKMVQISNTSALKGLDRELGIGDPSDVGKKKRSLLLTKQKQFGLILSIPLHILGSMANAHCVRDKGTSASHWLTVPDWHWRRVSSLRLVQWASTIVSNKR